MMTRTAHRRLAYRLCSLTCLAVMSILLLPSSQTKAVPLTAESIATDNGWAEASRKAEASVQSEPSSFGAQAFVVRRHKGSPSPGTLPSGMTFEAIEGGANPASQTLSVTNKGKGNTTLDWSVTTSTPWLSVSPAQGTTRRETDVVTVSVNVAGLAAGSYDGTITLTTNGTTTATQEVDVALDIKAPVPTLTLNPSSLSFATTFGSSPPASQTASIKNTGGGTMNWTATSSAPWLVVSPGSGSTTTETDQMSVSINASGMGIGTYEAPITIASSGTVNAPQSVPVMLSITAASTNVTISWDAPTTNTDGSPLTNLAGYKVYLGTAPRSYTSSVDAGQAKSIVLTNLTQGKTYYFTVTAYNTSNIESAYSAELSKTMQ